MSRFGLSLKQVSPKLFGLKKHGFHPLFPSAVTSIIPSVTESGSLKLDQDLASLAYKVATRFAWANAFLPVPARVQLNSQASAESMRMKVKDLISDRRARSPWYPVENGKPSNRRVNRLNEASSMYKKFESVLTDISRSALVIPAGGSLPVMSASERPNTGTIIQTIVMIKLDTSNPPNFTPVPIFPGITAPPAEVPPPTPAPTPKEGPNFMLIGGLLVGGYLLYSLMSKPRGEL
ncbi:MAG TPA: hypothetical protein VJ044_00335 [Candidatus Hodarchaeales archaeon]|nr:hypothetical protein [Candidatus Hodarchaeales archaeon]